MSGSGERAEEYRLAILEEKLTRKRLQAAGWAAMLSALLTIPWLIFTFMFGGEKGVFFRIIDSGMVLLSTILTIFLLRTLNRMLQTLYGFAGVHATVSLMVQVNVVAAVATLTGELVPDAETGIGYVLVPVVLALGVLQSLFGMKLLSLHEDLDGLRKPYCYLNILAGVSLASLLLVPLGILLGAVADVMLGTIFMQSACKPGEKTTGN